MIIWATDVHLNYFTDEYITNFGKTLSQSYKASGLIISGDISLGNKLERNIKTLSNAVQMPIYLVLGNHDFWYSSFNKTESLLDDICKDKSIINLNKDFVKINDDTVITGFTGWYDCRFGTIDKDVQMNDWIKIEDFKNQDPIILSQNRSASYLSFKDRSISFKDTGIKNQIIVTHFPPFENLIKEKDDSKPFYGSSDSGKMLLEIKNNFDKVICLSGHTHNRARYNIDNLSCYVGEACRGKPSLAGIIDDDLSIESF